MEPEFHGAKVALFFGAEVLVYRRDNNPDIPFPDMFDLPGGGRENEESGTQCVVRETFEEFGIVVAAEDLTFVEAYPNWRAEGEQALFFVGKLTLDQLENVVFGDEGQYWMTMPVGKFLESDVAVPHLQQRLKQYLERH